MMHSQLNGMRVHTDGQGYSVLIVVELGYLLLHDILHDSTGAREELKFAT
jgi:hypothetical protein